MSSSCLRSYFGSSHTSCSTWGCVRDLLQQSFFANPQTPAVFWTHNDTMLYTAHGTALCEYPESEVKLNGSIGKLK